MSVKLIAFDMDGTLLDNDHVTIPEKNIVALLAAREKGVRLTAATGRTWCMIREVLGPLGGADYVISSNGAAVLETLTGQWIHTTPIPNQKAMELIAYLKGWNLAFEVYCRGQNYMEKSCIPLMPETRLSKMFTHYYDQITCFVESIPQAMAGQDVEKVDIFHVPPEHRAEISQGIQAIFPAELAHAGETNMEITAAHVTKGSALQRLCLKLSITADEVMAFGDGNNDVEMLGWAGWSFAMENGSEEVKGVAKGIAPPHYLGGLGVMVQKYVLGQE